MALYNEAYESRKQAGKALLARWDKVLNANGGIKDEHMAITTAICLENYLDYLKNDPRLIAEDQVNTGAFTGVNLALLGLIARVIPTLVGAELVGIQAMPTPRSPIFTLRWQRDNTKGTTTRGDELFKSPTPSGQTVGLDPFYTSELIRDEVAPATGSSNFPLIWANTASSFTGHKPYVLNGSVIVTAYHADGTVHDEVYFPGSYLGPAPITAVPTLNRPGGVTDLNGMTYLPATRELTEPTAHWIAAPIVTKISYRYIGEGESVLPEISFTITDAIVDLIRRQLRGKYTVDSAYDLKVLHGINLDNELSEMMKIELTAEINREIVRDLRMMAAITRTLDYDVLVSHGVTTVGNYQDSQRVLLDAVNVVCAEIWNIGRLGHGNFLVGNPTTLAFLDRVPGYAGSGVTYNGRDLSFAGSLGGKIKIYKDPNYPKNEFLIGYKGPGALDAGYIHCPYLPITATPTMINQETGDPAKIFYTRYGKTFYDRGGGADGSQAKQMILMGEYQYARLNLANYPAVFFGS